MSHENFGNSSLDLPRSVSTSSEDDYLIKLGYEPQMKREFSWFSVISYAISITAILAGVMATFYTPLMGGGPSAIVWNWFYGSIGCFTIGLSVAELVSAYVSVFFFFFFFFNIYIYIF